MQDFRLNIRVPFFCLSPLTQNRAFSFLTEPSGNLLHLKAHVEGRTFILGFRSTISQEFFSVKVDISLSIASMYPSDRSPFMAWCQLGVSAELAFILEAKGENSSIRPVDE